MLSKDDLADVFNNFIRKNLSDAFTPKSVEFESATFRQPELYGLPIFVIGYGGRTISYVGQYIAHKLIRVREGNKVRTRWRILTGFVRILAKHREEDVYIELLANGAPAVGVLEWMSNRDQYIILEDRKELNEIECYEEDIVNLANVMNYEDPVILIDVTGMLKDLPADVFGRYTELVSVYKALQNHVYEMESTLEDLKIELEHTKAENRVLRSMVHRLGMRIVAVSGALMHYKSELLKQKELLQFYLERLEAVQEGKENLRKVINDFYDFMESVSPLIEELSGKIEQIESLAEEIESLENKVKKLRTVDREKTKRTETKKEKKEDKDQYIEVF